MKNLFVVNGMGTTGQERLKLKLKRLSTKVDWSDRGTWPGLHIKIELMPWHWTMVPYFYRAEHIHPSDGEFLTVEWLGVTVGVVWNNPPFTQS